MVWTRSTHICQTEPQQAHLTEASEDGEFGLAERHRVIRRQASSRSAHRACLRDHWARRQACASLPRKRSCFLCPHSQRTPALHPTRQLRSPGSALSVTSGAKVTVTINKAPKSQPAAPCLFPARDRDKLISSIQVRSSCPADANGLTWPCQPQGCRRRRSPEWQEFLEAGKKVESVLLSTWGTPSRAGCPSHPSCLSSPGTLLLQPPPLLWNSVSFPECHAVSQLCRCVCTSHPSLSLGFSICKMGWPQPLGGMGRI